MIRFFTETNKINFFETLAWEHCRRIYDGTDLKKKLGTFLKIFLDAFNQAFPEKQAFEKYKNTKLYRWVTLEIKTMSDEVKNTHRL